MPTCSLENLQLTFVFFLHIEIEHMLYQIDMYMYIFLLFQQRYTRSSEINKNIYQREI